ncbi:Putative signal transduction protein involved in RNA splicing [Ceraceosorus bombacis]|uniref:Putative signal transduction protein involved in RNA splicing n=1 Tax=Ceraceosorus bombacis TaxID=401625 RepID=A0A0P1BKV5_9BASI|nr:Putative signal transduction protein involved in RNA splicing [Ceraceosorus bombacis]
MASQGNEARRGEQRSQGVPPPPPPRLAARPQALAEGQQASMTSQYHSHPGWNSDTWSQYGTRPQMYAYRQDAPGMVPTYPASNPYGPDMYQSVGSGPQEGTQTAHPYQQSYHSGLSATQLQSPFPSRQQSYDSAFYYPAGVASSPYSTSSPGHSDPSAGTPSLVTHHSPPGPSLATSPGPESSQRSSSGGPAQSVSPAPIGDFQYPAPGVQPGLEAYAYSQHAQHPLANEGHRPPWTSRGPVYGTGVAPIAHDPAYLRARAEGKKRSNMPPGATLRPRAPAPDAPRSQFVMWMGNIPSNATSEELHGFLSQLTQPVDHSAAAAAAQDLDEQQITSDASNAAKGQVSALAAADTAFEAICEGHGIVSIFVIARSNCAFVNYATVAHLDAAVDYFHDKQLRPLDASSVRLVCRVRKKEDESQAGVEGQRGRGIHVALVKEYERQQKQKAAELEKKVDTQTAAATSVQATIESNDALKRSQGPSTEAEAMKSALAVPDVSPAAETASMTSQRPSIGGATSSSGSISISTNSSLLKHHVFRQRFFILKSLYVKDLDQCLATSIWATQPHNEAVLDQAYRNSEAVYLIFSANQSGNFYGYARMAGSIATSPRSKGDTPMSEGAPRSNAGDDAAKLSVIASAEKGDEEVTTGMRQSTAFSTADNGKPKTVAPGALSPIRSLPVPADSEGVKRIDTVQSERDKLSGSPTESTSLGPADSVSVSGANEQAQMSIRAMIHNLRLEEREAQRQANALEGHLVALGEGSLGPREAHCVSTPRAKPADAGRTSIPESGPGLPNVREKYSWGRPFRVQWLMSTPLPFSKVRKLRNPWRDGKPVMVSRDGTEVEPNAGRQLIEEWARHVASLTNSKQEASISTNSSSEEPAAASAHIPGLTEDVDNLSEEV